MLVILASIGLHLVTWWEGTCFCEYNFDANSQKTWERKTSIEWKQFWPCTSKNNLKGIFSKKPNAKPILLYNNCRQILGLHVSCCKLKLDAWILHNYGGCENSKQTLKSKIERLMGPICNGGILWTWKLWTTTPASICIQGSYLP